MTARTPRLVLASPEPPTGRGTARLSLTQDATRKLLQWGYASGATLHELVLAAWSLVLAQTLQNTAIVFGIVVALRPPEVPGSADTVGLLMNTVPFRIDIRSDAAELLVETRRSLAESLEHADVPAEQLFRNLHEHGWSEGFETLLVFENYPGDRTGARLGDDGRLTVLSAHEASETPFILVALPDEALAFELLHASAHESMARRLCRQLERVLSRFAALSESIP